LIPLNLTSIGIVIKLTIGLARKEGPQACTTSARTSAARMANREVRSAMGQALAPPALAIPA